jgi:predicted Zn-dependent peptidase
VSHTVRARAARLTTTAALLVLAAAPALAQQPARQTPPAPGTPKDFTLPPRATFTLDNGLEVSLVRWGTIPKTTVRLVVRGGNAAEQPGENYLADITGAYLQEGTTTRGAAALARDFAEMGSGIGVSVGAEQTTISTDVLGERAADAVRLLADVARNPSFPESELPRLKANAVRQISIARSRPGTIADERFRSILYGDHPFGRPLPSEATVNGFTVEQIRRFHAGTFGAARSRLYVVGVFDSAAVARAVREAFGDWARGTPPAALPAPKFPSVRQVAVIDRPKAVQSTLYLGLPVVDPSKPDWVPLQVTNSLLGGSFGSRITTNIREQKGYTYSPFSTLVSHTGDAYWVQIADVTTNVTGPSIKEILSETERLRSEAPPRDELLGIQRNIAGIFTIQNSSRAGIAGQLGFVDQHGLGDEYLRGYVRNVLAVTPADVQRIARSYLVPDRMSLVVVGDTTVVNEQIAPWATVAP